MKQTITFHDKRKQSKDRQKGQNISLKIDQNVNTVTITLERGAGKPEACTFPLENSETDASSWFDHIETVASDAPLEYSEEHFSVCDVLEDITADDNAFRILADAVYSMSGLKMTKPLAAMMGDRTLLELACALDTAGGSGAGKKAPENAVQIINAELNRISKK